MEWAAPGIVLAAAPYGEGDALCAVLSEESGLYRGLVRGGGSRARAATWQPGNIVQLRWTARLPEQLGSFTGELVHAPVAFAMQDRVALAVLASACATAAGALPEREPQPAIFRGLLRVLAGLATGPEVLTDLVRWELDLLRELGFGLDLSRCAVTGVTGGLAYVSPRTGRAVSAEGAGLWRERLLPLPGFLYGNTPPDAAGWRQGLALAGHFLARDVFGARHQALPAARQRLAEIVAGLPEDDSEGH